MDYLICHYNEIGLKGKNRKFFERKLIENIKRVLDPKFFEWGKRISGRIIFKLNKKGIENQSKIEKSLKNVFGIAYFAFSIDCQQKIDAIEKKALEVLKDKKFKTFKISTKRSEKNFLLTSLQLNERAGEYILKKFKIPKSKIKIKVDLKNPDITCFIEIVEKYAFLYIKRTEGLGGLPVSVSGKAVCLLSGGIDSPVAAFLMMKRGIKISFLHFSAYPYTNKASIEKVKKIIKILGKFQSKSKLYIVPFSNIQKKILLKTPASLRIILYRRMMLRIAQEIAKKEKALVLVTGESVGQVASQTLENIRVIEEVSAIPVLRPVIGQDKEEIIQMAKKIGTFNTSILPDQDCCSRFLPKHPETRARLKEVKKAEEKIDCEKLIQEAIKQTTLQII